jgi:hypothetical protein
MARIESDPELPASSRTRFAGGPSGLAPDGDPAIAAARRYLEYAPVAAAVVSGAAHGLVFANATFRQLAEDAGTRADVGLPVVETLPAGARTGLTALLNRVRRDGMALRDAPVRPAPIPDAPPPRARWSSSIWPVSDDAGRRDYLVVTLRTVRRGEYARSRHRVIAERLLLTALREQERASRADSSRARAVFLSESSLRLSASLEQEAAFVAVATVALPTLGAWSIVDVAAPDGSWRRLDIVHPEPAKQDLSRELAGHWSPAPGDPFGAPLVADGPPSCRPTPRRYWRPPMAPTITASCGTSSSAHCSSYH